MKIDLQNRTHLVVLGCIAALLFVCFSPSKGSGKSSAQEIQEPPPKPVLNLAGRFSPAIFSEHDLYLNNTSGSNLTDVHLRITFVGEDASPEVSRYWENWRLGEQQIISIAMSQVKNVQRIELSGEAAEGRFDASLTPPR